MSCRTGQPFATSPSLSTFPLLPLLYSHYLFVSLFLCYVHYIWVVMAPYIFTAISIIRNYQQKISFHFFLLFILYFCPPFFFIHFCQLTARIFLLHFPSIIFFLILRHLFICFCLILSFHNFFLYRYFYI